MNRENRIYAVVVLVVAPVALMSLVGTVEAQGTENTGLNAHISENTGNLEHIDSDESRSHTAESGRATRAPSPESDVADNGNHGYSLDSIVRASEHPEGTVDIAGGINHDRFIYQNSTNTWNGYFEGSIQFASGTESKRGLISRTVDETDPNNDYSLLEAVTTFTVDSSGVVLQGGEESEPESDDEENVVGSLAAQVGQFIINNFEAILYCITVLAGFLKAGKRLKEHDGTRVNYTLWFLAYWLGYSVMYLLIALLIISLGIVALFLIFLWILYRVFI